MLAPLFARKGPRRTQEWFSLFLRMELRVRAEKQAPRLKIGVVWQLDMERAIEAIGNPIYDHVWPIENSVILQLRGQNST